MEVFEKHDCVPLKEGPDDAFGVKYKSLRKAAKEIALASTYGVQARELSGKIDKSTQDTQAVIDDYFEKFPKVAQMVKKAHKTMKAQGYVTTMFGRPRRMPEAKKIDKLFPKMEHNQLDYNWRKFLNTAVNFPIQGAGGSICNRSMIKFYNDAKDAGLEDCFIVSQVHDEIIVECKEQDAETAKLLLQNAMETAVELPGVALEAIPTMATRLGELK
jgi:DNA polymerase-1